MPRACALLLAILALGGCSDIATTSTPSTTPSADVPAGTATPTTAAAPVQAATARANPRCGSPSDHVYHLYRLHLLDPCRTVTGTLVTILSEADGDYHVRLALDAAFAGMLLPANSSGQRGDLVLEPICQHAVSQADAVAPCAGGMPLVPIPPMGTHVSATGAYVLDEGHGGWAELHPLYEIHPG